MIAKQIEKVSGIVLKVLREGAVAALGSEAREEDVKALQDYFDTKAMNEVKAALKAAGVI